MIDSQLNNKNILFLCVKTFKLEEQIKAKLESFGARVYFYDERIKDTNFNKAIIRVKKELYRNKIEKYYYNILEQTKSVSFDYLLVIRGEVVPAFFLERFKEIHPNCILIFYNWDSFKNTPNTSNHLNLYDRKFSFDPEDARNYGVNFRPLYFTDTYKTISTPINFKYDLLFLGTAHSDRYIISSQIKDFLERNEKNVFCYYFMHSKWVYYFKKAFDKTFKYFDFNKLSFKSLSVEEIKNLYEESKVILDINHPHQKGLTMRTFEAIGSKRKLITTNREIKKFDFYNSSNVYVLDRNNIEIDLKFFDLPFIETDPKLYERLSISGWLFNLFFDSETDYWQRFL